MCKGEGCTGRQCTRPAPVFVALLCMGVAVPYTAAEHAFLALFKGLQSAREKEQVTRRCLGAALEENCGCAESLACLHVQEIAKSKSKLPAPAAAPIPDPVQPAPTPKPVPAGGPKQGPEAAAPSSKAEETPAAARAEPQLTAKERLLLVNAPMNTPFK